VNPEAHNRPLVRYLPSLACQRRSVNSYSSVLSWKLPARVEGNLRISSCKTAYPCTSAGDVSADTEQEPMRVAEDAEWLLRREWD